MAKRGRKRHHPRRGNGCCPIIKVKCGRGKRRRGHLGDSEPGFLRSAEQVLNDRRAMQAAAHKKAVNVYCTIKVGAKSRRVHVSRVHGVVSKLVRRQHLKRCVPLLNGKLIIGQRASKF